MLDIDHERREGERIALRRPCKVYEPRSRRYIAGSTCNVTPGGMLLRLDRPVDLDAGDHVYIGLARKRRHAILRADEMMEAEVVRVMPITSGETAIAVHFIEPGGTAVPALRQAA